MLSRMFNVAASTWGFESLRNPVANVVRPKVPAGRTRRINGPAEWRALLEVYTNSVTGPPMACSCTLTVEVSIAARHINSSLLRTGCNVL